MKFPDAAKEDISNVLNNFKDLQPEVVNFTFPSDGFSRNCLSLTGTIPIHYKVFNEFNTKINNISRDQSITYQLRFICSTTIPMPAHSAMSSQLPTCASVLRQPWITADVFTCLICLNGSIPTMTLPGCFRFIFE